MGGSGFAAAVVVVVTGLEVTAAAEVPTEVVTAEVVFTSTETLTVLLTFLPPQPVRRQSAAKTGIIYFDLMLFLSADVIYRVKI